MWPKNCRIYLRCWRSLGGGKGCFTCLKRVIHKKRKLFSIVSTKFSPVFSFPLCPISILFGRLHDQEEKHGMGCLGREMLSSKVVRGREGHVEIKGRKEEGRREEKRREGGGRDEGGRKEGGRKKPCNNRKHNCIETFSMLSTISGE